MPPVTITFKVKDDGSFKRAMNDNTKEADALVERIKVLAKTTGKELVLSLGQARTLLFACGNDTKRFQAAMREAGVSAADARVITSQLKKELTDSAKASLGIETNQKKANQSIRDGVFAAEALQAVFDKIKEKLDDIADLGGVKGLKDATKDAMELNDKYDELRRKLGMAKDPASFAKVRENIENTSIRHNLPQSQLIDAVLTAQESKSAGRELALENRGGFLDQIAKNLYADDIKQGDIADAVKGQVIMAKNFGFQTPAEIREMQNILRAGEEAGSLSAKGMQLKSGGLMAQWAGARKIGGFGALRETQAVLQTIADDPSVAGNLDQANVVMENAIGKAMDTETGKRFKKNFGVDIRDSKGYLRDPTVFLSELAVSQKGGKFKIPQSDADLELAENDPAKASEYKAFFDTVRDKEARRGFLALYRGRDKLRQLRDVDSSVGARLLDEAYDDRLGSTRGQLDARERRDELTHARDTLARRAPVIVNASNVLGQLGADHPILQEGLGLVSKAAGAVGPSFKLAVDSTIASGVMLGIGTNIKNPRNELAYKDALLAQQDQEKRQNALLEQKYKYEQMKADAMFDNKFNIVVKVETGMTATVTTEGDTVANKSKSGTRVTKKAGQR